MTVCLPETEVAEVPCEEGDHGGHGDREDPPGPSYGADHGVQVPSCRVVEVPTAEQEYSGESAFSPAALGSGEGQMSESGQLGGNLYSLTFC